MTSPKSEQVRESEKARRESGQEIIRASPVWIEAKHIPTSDDKRRVTAEATKAVRRVLKKYIRQPDKKS